MTFPLKPFTQQDLLDQIEQIMPLSWLYGLQNPGPGYEIIQSSAAVFARVSEAVARLDKDLYVLSATDGAYGIGQVKVTRSGNLEALTLRSGSMFTCSASGRMFVLTTDLSYAVDSLTSTPEYGTIRSLVQSYDQNVSGRAITAAGEIIQGEIDTISVAFVATATGDQYAAGLKFEIENVDPVTGAAWPALDLLGYDRGLPRRTSENTVAYRNRTRSLPDTVSPDAMIRAIKSALYQYTQQFEFIETFEVNFQTAFDSPLPPYAAPDLMSPAYDPTCFVLDDPRPDTPYRNRCPNASTYFSCFFVVVPLLASIQNYTVTPDDPALNTNEFISVGVDAGIGARRATSAYDMPVDMPVAAALQCAIDGEDWRAASVYRSLYQQLQEIKPAGTRVIITTPN